LSVGSAKTWSPIAVPIRGGGQEIRGQVVDGDVGYFQVTIKIDFRVED
jgi:dodecin